MTSIMPSLYVLFRKSDPEKIRYVGVTVHEDVMKRFNAHLHKTKNGVNRPVNDWIAKYYPDIDVKKVGSASSWEEICAQEIKLIAKLKNDGHRLLNQTLGGEGTAGFKDSDETRAKKSLALTGHEVTQETRSKISKSNTGKRRTAEAKKKMSEKKLGKKLSKEHAKKIGAANTGKKRSPEQCKTISDSLKGRKMSDSHYKSIVAAQQKRRLREKLEKEQGLNDNNNPSS
jgi:hypothetical protein